jgi:hypothetical protein
MEMNSNNISDTPRRLTSRWHTLARLGWVVLTILVIFLFALGVALGFEELAGNVDRRALRDLGISFQDLAYFNIGVNLVVILAHVIIAGVIFWRLPDNWMALFVAFALVAAGSLLPLSQVYRPEIVRFPILIFLANLVIYTGLISSVMLLYLFPTGQFVPAWTRVLAIAVIFFGFFAVFVPESALSIRSWPRLLQIVAILIGSLTGIFAQIYRYENVSSPVQRQQTKWALIGLTAAVAGPAIWLFTATAAPETTQTPNLFYQRLGASFFTSSLLFSQGTIAAFRLATILFPLSFAIAILRYRLWEIDVIINRTLVYGTVTGALLLFYAISIFILGAVFSNLSGRGDQLAITISTLTIAILFNPLRARVQRAIDRRFYRQKYDAEQILAGFSVLMRYEVDLDNLSTALLKTAAEAMQPKSLSLWLLGRDDRGGIRPRTGDG